MIYHCTAFDHDPEEGEEPNIQTDVEADSPSQALMKVAKQHGRLVKATIEEKK